MAKRRFSEDEHARVPFAMVAVLILMLSVFSMAYLGGIQRQGASLMMLDAETSRQSSILTQVETRMALDGSYVASCAIAATTQFLCDQTKLDACFSENYSAYLTEVFPMYIDPYTVEVRDFRSAIFLEERKTHDLVPSDSTVQSDITLKDEDGTVTNASVDVLDTVTCEELNETSVLARYTVSGWGNCTVRNTRSGSASERPIGFEKGIDSPFPLMNSKALAMESAGDNNAMGLVRTVKYILTTLAQFRVLEGYGSGLDDSPGPVSEIISLADVQLSVNIAVLLETVRLFRNYDRAVLLELDGLGIGAGAKTLESLFGSYITTGTLDPADIVAVFTGLGDRDIPADMILAQAFNAVADQFILKYLDYFGITDIANSIYKTGQQLKQFIEDAGKAISDFIFGDDGEGRDEIQQVTDWLVTNTCEMGWPPGPGQFSVPGIGVSEGLISSTSLAVLDIYEPVNGIFQYTANCTQLIGEYCEPIVDADGFAVGEIHYTTVQSMNITAQTAMSSGGLYPEGYLANFTPIDMIRTSEELDELWKAFYTDHYADSEDVIYDTIKDAVKNVTYELSGLITSFMGQGTLSLSSYGDGEFAIDPKDRASMLQDMRDMVAEVITATVTHLQENPGTIESLLTVLTDSQSQITLRMIEFIALNYDTLASKEDCIDAATDSLSLSMLQNSSVSFETIGTYSAAYSVYNDLGHSQGLLDDSLPYDCAEEPDAQVFSHVLYEQNSEAVAADILPYAESAYSKLKAAEAGWSYMGDPANGAYIKALEETVESLSGSILMRFIGSDASSLVGLARDMVITVLNGIIWSGGVANTQYAPEIVFSDASGNIGFDLYEGEEAAADEAWTESFAVSQPDGVIEAVLGSAAASAGTVAVNITGPYGVHFTDITSFNERPYENLWNISIVGNVRIDAAGSSMPYIINGSHEPADLSRTIELEMSIPILAYSGWELSGVEYASTSTLAGDVEKLLDIATAFFDWVWDTIAAPINWVIDQVMKIVDFFADIMGKLLAYASDIMDMIVEMIGFLVEKVQDFMRDVADLVLNSIVDWIISLLPDGTEFEFSLLGFDFAVCFATEEEMDDIDAGLGGELMSVRTGGRLLGAGFEVGLELWSLSENVSAEADLEYDLLLDAQIDIKDFTLDIDVDPFMLLQDRIIQCRGGGEGWQLELDSPVVEIPYDSVKYSLQDIAGVGTALSNIPIPFLGLKASVDAGLEMKYTLHGLEEDNPVINEVELNPRGLNNGTQWVELYNPTDANYSLGNCTLSYDSNASHNVTFNSTIVLGPSGYWIVYFNDTLPTDSVKIELLDPGGNVIDSTSVLTENDDTTVNGIPTGTTGCMATWQREPNGANFTLAGSWNFTQSTIGMGNAAADLELKPIVLALLKGAFNSTWQELKGELALTLDFIVELVTRFIQRFIDDVLTVVEHSVVETALFLDVKLTDATGAGGGGITLSFIIEGGDALAAVLRWIIGSVSAFLAKFGKPTQPSQYPKLDEGVPEHLFIRLEFYAMVQMPKMLKAAAQTEEELETVRLAGRIEANIPALAALVGKDMGSWRVNFGAFVENVPAAIADPLFGTGDEIVNIWLFKGTVWEI